MRHQFIKNNQPIFQKVFGESWDRLPPVMKKHYAVRPYSDDIVKVEGYLDIKISFFVSLMARLTGMLVSYSGNDVPTTVVFRSDQSGAFYFDRTFHFPEKDVAFCSRMEWIRDNELVEFMRFGIGWRLAYEWDGRKVILNHRGYIWRILGVMIPIPAALIIGKGHAEEIPLTENLFSMWTHTKHPLLGKTLQYAGKFKVIEMSCGLS